MSLFCGAIRMHNNAQPQHSVTFQSRSVSYSRYQLTQKPLKLLLRVWRLSPQTREPQVVRDRSPGWGPLPLVPGTTWDKVISGFAQKGAPQALIQQLPVELLCCTECTTYTAQIPKCFSSVLLGLAEQELPFKKPFPSFVDYQLPVVLVA